MDITELRSRIDKIDTELVRLFTQRMEISAQIADYKKQKGLPIFVPEREHQILQAVAEKSGTEMQMYTKALYAKIFELSRTYQESINKDS